VKILTEREFESLLYVYGREVWDFSRCLPRCATRADLNPKKRKELDQHEKKAVRARKTLVGHNSLMLKKLSACKKNHNQLVMNGLMPLRKRSKQKTKKNT
jgi:hypothetical protein